jgi:uncharacterized protein YbcV (DUF1398 family)
MPPARVAALSKVWDQVYSPEGLSFPQVMQQLAPIGVDRYHVDFVSRSITAYMGLEFERLQIDQIESVNAKHEFNVSKIKEVVREIQANNLSYTKFCEGLIEAGVTNYWAYLAGQRVIYASAEGDFHTEWFPGATKRPQSES